MTIVALTIPASALAQCAGQDALIGHLRRELQELRAQLALIEGRVNELAAAGPGTGPAPGTLPPGAQVAHPPPAPASAHVGETTSTYETLRSSAVYGYSHVQNTGIQPDSTYRSSHYAAGNLIWNLFGAVDVGAEYLFGRNEHQDGQAASASRVQVSMKYAFVRVDRRE